MYAEESRAVCIFLEKSSDHVCQGRDEHEGRDHERERGEQDATKGAKDATLSDTSAAMSAKGATMNAKDASMSAKDATRCSEDATMSAKLLIWGKLKVEQCEVCCEQMP